MIDLSFKPLSNGLRAGEASTLDVMIRISPVAVANEPAPRRPPLNLALVIDRSGSMKGRPLREAKRCADMVIDRLSPSDRLAIVAYDDQVDVVLPSTPVEDRSTFKRAIASIDNGGTTNLHGGWHAGATEVATALQSSGIARVLLLSDGQANSGEARVDVIARHCAELAAADVSTSTYGLGESFNEDLMTAMAKSGQGQAHYGRSAEDLIDPFQQEFDLLSALVARKLRLEVTPESGVRFRLLNLFARDPGTGAHMLPDLAAGGELWAIVRLDIDAGVGRGRSGPVRLISANLTYTDRDNRRGAAAPAVLHLEPLSPAAYAALEADTTVRDRIAELEVARLADEAREAARQGDWERVEELTRQMRETALGNAWVEESVQSLQALARSRNREGFSKEALYKGTRMRTRMASREEFSGSWSLEEESAKASYLRRKSEEGRRFDNNSGANGNLPSSRQAIGTQAEWEAVKGRFRNASDHRDFRAEYFFDPRAMLERTSLQVDQVLRTSTAGGSRWMIFESMTGNMTVDEINALARHYRNSERDADIFIALHRGFLRFADRSGATGSAA